MLKKSEKPGGKKQVGTPRHTIELNGNLYDAVTGEIVKTGVVATKPVHKPPASTGTGKVLDGFTRRTPAPASHSQPAHKIKTAEPAKPVKVTSHPKTVRHAAKPVQKSKTLMRHTVHKPKPHAEASPSVVTHQIPASRMNRAGHVGRSQLISRFGQQSNRLAAQVVPLAVQLPPAAHSDFSIPATARRNPSPASGHTVREPRHKKNFEHAIHAAQGHKQPKVKKAKISHRAAKKLRVSPRLVRLSTSFAAGLLIIGFIVYQNIPNLAMKVASARAGIPAHLPDYQPAGFALNGAIQYSPGQITVNYRSNSDERVFTLLQKSTDWTDETLLENHVASGNRPYQTYQDEEQLIYIYGDSNATWIDDGIWYQIEGNSVLNSDQLLRLATSI